MAAHDRHDLVIRNGTVVDGTGAPAFVGDVAIDDGRIAAVGRAEPVGAGRRGDRRRRPAGHARAGSTSTPTTTARPPGTTCWRRRAWHGVTTVVMGNCGVGFAPAAPDRHDWLIGLMEGVEDIPGTALAEGIDWEWETLPRVPRRARRPGAGRWTSAPRSPTARCAPT